MMTDERPPPDVAYDDLDDLANKLQKFNWKEGIVDRAKALLYSENVHENMEGVNSLKQMLCIQREEVFGIAQDLIDSEGVIRRLVQFLSFKDSRLRLAAAFCLTNVAAGRDEQTAAVVESGAVEPLITMLRSDDEQLRRQAVFCLANIAGSTADYRLLLARHPDFFESLFDAANRATEHRVPELVSWNLRNVCVLGGPSYPEYRRALMFLLERAISSRGRDAHGNSSIMRFTCEALAAAARVREGRTDLLSLPCVAPYLLHVARYSSSNQAKDNALEAFSELCVSAPDDYKEQLLRQDAIETLLFILFSSYPNTISNSFSLMTRGSKEPDSNNRIRERVLKCFLAFSVGPPSAVVRLAEASLPRSLGVPGDSPLVYCFKMLRDAATETTGIEETRICRAYSALVLCNVILNYSSGPSEGYKLLNNDVVSIALEALEHAMEELSHEAEEPANQAKVFRASAPVSESFQSSSAGGELHTEVDFDFYLGAALTGLNAIGRLMELGANVAEDEQLLVNPVLQYMAEYNGRSRITSMLHQLILPPQVVERASKLLAEHFENMPI